MKSKNNFKGCICIFIAVIFLQQTLAYSQTTKTSLLVTNPGPQVFDEEQSYTINITAQNSARIFVSGMPPGMIWNEAERSFDFRPDFIQGGKTWVVTMDAIDGTNTHAESFSVTVNNTIQPPSPTIITQEYLAFPRMTRYTLRQVTDDFLDPPALAGREFTAIMTVPDAASADNLLPLEIRLHAFGGSPGTVGGRELFGLSPHDSDNTWWTGYNDQYPDGVLADGVVHNHTQRRVMHLLSYMVENYPGVDLNRVRADGQSMGGTGSFFLALRYARHLTSINSRIGGTSVHFIYNGSSPRLIQYWGTQDLMVMNDLNINAWNYFDVSRGLIADRSFRNMYFTSTVGKNDSLIVFDHVVKNSPVTGVSFFNTVQQQAIGHFLIWDQRAHSSSDGDLGGFWWEPLDVASELVRNRAFPVFTNSSADDDVGTPDGLGGYTGSLRGGINRYQRWDSLNIVDTRDLLSVPIKVDIDTTGTPPETGFPPLNNYYYGVTPIVNDITIRRIQLFQVLPNEAINWTYDSNSGSVNANSDGSITISNIAMKTTYTTLTLQRQSPVFSDSIFSSSFE